MTLKLFIAGTDTEVGKTYVSAGLLEAFNLAGYTTLGIKPVAAGAMRIEGMLRNEDALTLQAASSLQLPYEEINPVVYEFPAGASIAAARVGETISVAAVVEAMQPALNSAADVLLVEGIGGWLMPLNGTETMADIAIECALPVVLVVGIRLGCMNHAIMTYQAIKNSGLPVVGWVANCLEPEMLPQADEIVATLKEWLQAPCLAVINYKEKVEAALQASGSFFAEL